MKKYPSVAVSIVFRCKGEILILGYKNGVFNFPGGRMEWKESILEALDRELKEEIDYSLKYLKHEPVLFNVWNYVSRNGRRHRVYINYIYQLNRKPNLSSPEKLKILWLTRKEILSKNIIKDRNFLNKIFNYKKSKN